MRQLDKRIVTLRLRLAEISSREEQLKALRRQFKAQVEKVAEFALYENGDLDAALSMADEVDTRRVQTEGTLRNLDAIKARCKEELQALLLTKSIETAKTELTELETRRRELDAEIERLREEEPAQPEPEGGEPRTVVLERQRAEIEAEIRRLRAVIDEASDQAGRAVSSRSR